MSDPRDDLIGKLLRLPRHKDRLFRVTRIMMNNPTGVMALDIETDDESELLASYARRFVTNKQ